MTNTCTLKTNDSIFNFVLVIILVYTVFLNKLQFFKKISIDYFPWYKQNVLAEKLFINCQVKFIIIIMQIFCLKYVKWLIRVSNSKFINMWLDLC